MTKSANPSQQTYRESGLVQSPKTAILPFASITERHYSLPFARLPLEW